MIVCVGFGVGVEELCLEVALVVVWPVTCRESRAHVCACVARSQFAARAVHFVSLSRKCLFVCSSCCVAFLSFLLPSTPSRGNMLRPNSLRMTPSATLTSAWLRTLPRRASAVRPTPLHHARNLLCPVMGPLPMPFATRLGGCESPKPPQQHGMSLSEVLCTTPYQNPSP